MVRKRYKTGQFKMYEPGEGVAGEIGFTAEKFQGYIYVDSTNLRHPDLIFSMVISTDKHKGNFKKCVEAALQRGYKVVIPTPTGKMIFLVRKWGFKQKYIKDPEMGVVETWERKKKLE